MKKIFSFTFLLIILIICSSIYYFLMHENAELPGTALSKSFNDSGAKVVSGEVYLWGRLGSDVNNLDNIKQLAGEFAGELGLSGQDISAAKITSNELIEKVEVNGISERNTVVSITASLGKTEARLGDRVMSVSLVQDMISSGLEEMRQSAEKVFKKYNIQPKVNYNITGNFDGRLDTQALNEISAKIFKKAEARKVYGLRDKNLISVSAYSPFMGDSIKVNGEKTNLNLAIRYNNYENKTYIWLATPVITTEY